MIKRTTIGIWLCCVLALSMDAQRIHFSDFGEAQMQLSPALTGAYKGSLRAGLKFREQYRGFITQPFRTSQVYVDAPRGMKMADHHWIGIGMLMTRSDAGDLSMLGMQTGLSLAYHRALDKKFKTIVSVGTQVLHSALQINNPTAARFEDQLLATTGESRDQSLIDDFKSQRLAHKTGVAIKKIFNKRIVFQGGVSVQMDLRQWGTANTQSRLLNQYSAFGNWDIRFDKKSKITWKPSFVVHQAIGLTSAVGALGVQHYLNDESDFLITYSGGYRLKDAAILGVRLSNDIWSASLQYDMTTSSAQNYNGMNGALEFGISRVFIIYPKVKEKVLFICPRL